MFWDPRKPDVAYIVGLLQTDGSHDGSIEGKGKIALELAVRDATVLEQISEIVPCYSSVRLRTRATNFKATYETATLGIFDQSTRRALAALGVTVGRKSGSIAPPAVPFSAPDYVRGLLDGDGSVGRTATGVPFISLVTASVALSTYFCEVIAEVCGVSRTTRPNTRDGVHNIMVTNVAAARLASWAWHSPDVLGIERKRRAAADVASWRPAAGREGRYGVVRRRWTPEDDEIVLSSTAEEAARALDRTLSSVSMRRWRLAKTQTTHR